MKSILDPAFRYTPSYGTDLRKTFARIRQEQASQRSGDVQPPRDGEVKVVRLDPRKALAT